MAGFLPEEQAGFRADRGTTEQIFVLSEAIAEALKRVEETNEILGAGFIDYTAAFDTVSHKFLDEALGKAGASNKCRKMFRKIYEVASAVVRMRDTDGTEVVSDPFNIDRGVVHATRHAPDPLSTFPLGLRTR